MEEGETAQFTVTLTGTISQTVTVGFQTDAGTATADDDYTSASGTLTFTPSDTTRTISVPTVEDTIREEDETFSVTLSNPAGATLADDTATGTITDDDTQLPALSIADADPVTEGDAAQFEVTLSAESQQVVTVAYATADGTAVEDSDYTPATGTLSFQPGDRTKIISVRTVDDTDPESEEHFSVTLSSPGGAILDNGSGQGTITDNDGDGPALPQLSITDASAAEGDTLQFTVTLTGTSSQTVTVDFQTGDGTAIAGSDYNQGSGTLTFSDTTQTISVPTMEDSIREEDETFSVTLSNPAGATLADDTATGTITDDDDTQLPALSIADADPVTEGDTAQFEVTLSAESQQVVTVSYATADGTAVADSDFAPVTGTLSFQPGDRTQTISVATLDDNDQESQEQFTVTLSGPGGATLSRDTGTGTIDDNDAPGTLPQLSIGDASAEEGDTVRFTVTLTGNRDQDVTVDFQTGDVTARARSDYNQNAGTLTFTPSDTTRTISVVTIEDGIREEDETFSVTLTNPEGATLADDTATGTIEDDDDTALPALSIADADPVTEGATAQFEVTLSAESQQVVTVAYATADGTAVEDADYTQTSGTLTFAAGETTKTIPVPTIDDDEQESEEHFIVTLSSPEGATLDDSSGQGTITDNDGDGPALPQLSITDASAAEGGTVQFTVTLTGTSNQTVTVDFQTGDGTAKAGSDYTAASGTVTFTAGETTRSISVATLEDTIREEDETFSVTLTNPEGATLADDTATGTITDDDDTALPALSIADADPVTEGATAQFEVTLSAESQQVVTVAYATADGTAVEDADYTQTSGTLTFAAGETTKTIPVPTIDDDEQESEEHFIVTLSSPEGATLDDSSGQGTITDNDGDGPALPQLSITDASAAEGGTVQFTVTLTGTSNQTVTVDFQTGDGTAKAGSDYTAASGTVTFTAGETTRSISVATLEDTIREEDETFSVTLTNPEGATLADDTATGTITDDDDTALPALSIADADPVTEGATAQFEVTLSAESQQVVTVAYATADGTAVEDADYTQTSGTLTFAAGETTKTIPVPTIDDDEQESEEHFIVTLSSPEGATLDDSSGQGTITDNDGDGPALPQLSITDASAAEGGTVQFTVTLTGTSNQTVTVDFQTGDGTAKAGSDYTAASGTVTFTAGETTRSISVATLEDTIREEDETFSVTLTNPEGATLADDTATGTITDDDDTALPALSIADADPVTEGATAQFEVTLSAESQQVVTVAYATADGTAVEDADYTQTSGTLTFAAGETTKTIPVPTIDDDEQESEEHFIVTLSSPEGATLDDSSGQGTITDNDGDGPALPQLSITDASAAEGGTVQFTVTLTGTSNQTVTVDFQTGDGTAKAGSDYTAASGTVTFTAGETTRSISVATLEDTIREEDETFSVTLTNPEGATLADDTATGTITDDDDTALPALSIADADPVTEGATAQFEVTLSAESQQVVTVAYATADGTAVEDADYTQTSGTLTFAAGETTRTIPVPTIDDDEQESEEHFTVTLSSPEGATLDDSSGQGTITDDDGNDTTPRLYIVDASADEGDAVRFRVVLTGDSDRAVTVDFETDDGTALAGSDYEETSGTLTFAVGTETQTISVPTHEDDIAEADETFTVRLSDADGATIEGDSARGTINDNDGGGGRLPILTIEDAAPVGEGETAQFSVTLSSPSEQVVTASYGTADGTASAGSDYTSTTGTLRFEAGDTTGTIRVTVLDDEIREDTESFTVELSDPEGAALVGASGTASITDDDEDMLPALSIGDAVPVAEGVTALFPVTLSAASEQVVTVAFATEDGTALDASDYTAAAGTLTFDPGTTRQSIEVATLEDDAEESEEGFTVTLSDPTGATLEDDTGTGTITDNDGGSGTLPEVSIGDAAAVEGGTATFEVTLRPAAGQAVTVRYRTLDGTALEGADYTGANGTLRFEPDQATWTIRVPVLDDEFLEETEHFTVELSDPAGATLGDGTGTGTITDNDEGKLPALSIGDAAPVTEGQTARFTVTLSAASEQMVTVAFATVEEGSAISGSDYSPASGTVTFSPGTRRQTIEVVTRQDEFVESEETFTVKLSDPTAATLEDETGVGTILDDDLVEGLSELAIADAAPVPEGGTASFVVTLSPASEREVRVSYRTLDGTATAGLDYAATEGTLRFQPGETTRSITVTTVGDELVEGPERFTVELSNSVAATIADGTGTGTISEAAERIAMVNRTVLPELGRALAFSTVRCRFDRTLAGPMARDGSGPAGYLSLPYALTSDRQTSPMHQALTLERALGDSSFLMPMQDEDGEAGRFAAWGCGDYRHLGGGGDGDVAWNGEAFSMNFGADVRLGSNTLAGLSVSRSRGSFDYRAGGPNGRTGGAYDLRLTGLHPYVGWSASPDLDIWGTVGHAWGELRIADDLVARTLTSAATLDSGAVGVNGRLLARGTTSLNLRGEAALARLDIAGDGALVEALAVNMRRLRLSTEASREIVFASGGSLTPWGELGVRHDGGDGETGAGLEVGGGLRYRNPEAGWTTEGYGRWLAAHEGALREWGFGGVIRYDPGASGRGPSVSLMPGWGDTASGVQRLWERGATDPTVGRPPGSRVDAQFGYGFAAFRGRGVLTPFGAVSLDREYGNGYRIGSRIAVGRSANLSLEAERRERAAAATVYAVFVRGALQF